MTTAIKATREQEQAHKGMKMCAICGSMFSGYGNNPSPVITEPGARCCSNCDRHIVIPARMYIDNLVKAIREEGHYIVDMGIPAAEDLEALIKAGKVATVAGIGGNDGTENG